METCVTSSLDRPAAELTVTDVYDIAAGLGQEFERVIDRFGCESLVGVVPKVVRVLELLEALVSRAAAGHEAEELRRELDRLRQERSDRFAQDKRHQRVRARACVRVHFYHSVCFVSVILCINFMDSLSHRVTSRMMKKSNKSPFKNRGLIYLSINSVVFVSQIQ